MLVEVSQEPTEVVAVEETVAILQLVEYLLVDMPMLVALDTLLLEHMEEAPTLEAVAEGQGLLEQIILEQVMVGMGEMACYL